MDQPITPDWSALRDEILCPLCRYNLRGLSEPRCPECGYAFDWPEVLDPTRRFHPYLFEHHPERNVWSFFRTLIGGLRPWRFWSKLHPGQPSDAWRLALYHLLVCGLLALPAVTHLAAKVWVQPSFLGRTWDDGTFYMVVHRPLSVTEELPMLYWFMMPTRRLKAAHAIWALPVFLLLLPYATLLPLGIFQWSMYRARVGYEHVRRCVIYSSDVAAWFALLLTLLVIAAHYNAYHRDIYLPSYQVKYVFAAAVFWIAPAVWLLMSLRLVSAIRRYLRFNHAWAVVLSAEVVLLLFLLAVALCIRHNLPIQ